MEKKITSPAVKGVIISLVLIVLSLIFQFLNLYKNKNLGFIPYVILFTGIIWSATSYARQMEGKVTFGNIFVHAFKTVAAVSAIIIVYTIISLNFISPEIKDYAIQSARAQMEAQNRSDDQIDNMIAFTEKHFVLLTVSVSLLFSLITGVIASLIGAAVSKKNPQQGPFVQQG